MIVLQSNIAYLRQIGLYFAPHQLRSNASDYAFNLLYIITTILCMAGCFAYSMVHVKEVVKMTHGLYVMSGASMSVFIYWVVALRKMQFRCVIEELQTIVGNSEWTSSEGLYF